MTTESWWVDCPRESWQSKVQAEQPRICESRFGTASQLLHADNAGFRDRRDEGRFRPKKKHGEL